MRKIRWRADSDEYIGEILRQMRWWADRRRAGGILRQMRRWARTIRESELMPEMRMWADIR